MWFAKLLKSRIGISNNESLRKYCFFLIQSLLKSSKYKRQFLFQKHVLFKTTKVVTYIKPDLNIDLFIPVISKDLFKLDTVIYGAKKNIQHNIKNIYIVAPDTTDIKDYCNRNSSLKYIDERSILGYGPETLKYFVNGKDRSGWLYQQLLKLNADKVCQNENFLVLDSDTEFIKHTYFMDSKGNHFLDFSDEFHMPYYKTYELLTGLNHKYEVSFVSHYMFMNSFYLKCLRKHIEDLWNKKLPEAICSLIPANEGSFFSEYETYANYVLEFYPKQHSLRYWFNYSSKKHPIPQEHKNKIINNGNKSISYHSYNVSH